MTLALDGRRIALIGGAGFIGHQLALSLKAQGADVHIVDSLQVNNMLSIATSAGPGFDRELYLKMINERFELLREAEIPLNIQDARDYHALSRVLDEIRPQTVVHAAAVAHAGRSNKDPHSTFDHSLRTLENALDHARTGGVEHFIFLSSSMAYGNFETSEVTEEHPLDPIGIYGALKVAGEKIVIAYNQVFGLDYTVVRPSALYGPRCISRRVGQIFIENALRGLPLRIAGDGSDRLDFTYIDDLVQGIELAITHEAARNEIFNMTFGSARAVIDVVDILRGYFPGLEIEFEPRDELMPERGTLSVEKARRLLGYAPQFDLDRGFAEYVEWYRGITADASSVA